MQQYFVHMADVIFQPVAAQQGKIPPCGQVVASVPAEGFKSFEERQAQAKKIATALNSHGVMLDGIYTALPYIETLKDDAGYKPGAVAKVERQLKDAIIMGEL